MRVNFIPINDNIYVEVGAQVIAELRKRFDGKRYFQCVITYPLSAEQLSVITRYMEELNGT
jgi:hypothetical protein